MEAKFQGIYEKTLYRNGRNGYTIFSIRTNEACSYKNKYGSITCAGWIPSYTHGTPITVTGEWEDTYYGKQINIKDIEEYSNDESVTINYLSSGICRGIGYVTAKKFVETFGSDVFKFVQQDNAEKLIEEAFPDIPALSLIKTIRSTIHQREVFHYIIKFGGTFPNAIRVCEKYGYNALKELKDNPYKVGRDAGLSFASCDSIGRKEGFHAIDSRRLKALIYEAINRYMSHGHTYITLEQMNKIVNIILSQSAYKESIPMVILLNQLAHTKGLVIEKGFPYKIFIKNIWNDEINIARELKRLNNSSTKLPFSEDLILFAEDECQITYAESQKAVFQALLKSGVKIVTGGPGTGKTTVIKGLLSAYHSMFPNHTISLCAPTGRAAQRITESTGREAVTIHRLLEYQPYGDDFSYKDKSDPINADLIVVDEVSMVDTSLFAILLGAIKNGSIVLLVGDENQLPSVGAGNVLHDLIASEKIEMYRLKTIYRQKKESCIVENSDKINNGIIKLESGPDFEILRASSEEEALDLVKLQVNKYHKPDDPYYMQVLTSTKKNELGTLALNKLIQSIVNQESRKVDYGNMSFRHGDKIMMLRNNYEVGYFNGDIGTITRIDELGAEVIINGEQMTIDKKDMDDMTLAYASTIHKSQGSEYPITIIVLPENPKIMLKRNLLFTAVTRAKTKTVIITVNSAMETAIVNSNTDKRHTRLLSRLLGEYSELMRINQNNNVF